MMTDIEKAISMLPDVWDDNNTGRPNKIAAMAFKSMSQLYDASPLMQNDLASVQVMEYDKERAKLAAQSANAVLKYIKNHPETENRLMSKDEYTDIFIGKCLLTHSRNIYGIIENKILPEPIIMRMKLLPDMYALFGCHQNMHREQGMMLRLIMLRRKIW